jgi:hypothetical protein
MYGTNPRTFLNRFDKDKSGALSYDEFRRLVRANLKVTPAQLTDKEIELFLRALDDDNSGEVNIAELIDFINRGAEALFNNLANTAGPMTMSAEYDGGMHEHGSDRGSRRGKSFRSSQPQNRVLRPTYNITGEAHTANDKEVTVPIPFTSMEMDVYLRRHKMDERERRLVLEVEEEKAARNRQAKKALVAEPGSVHLRLSQSNVIVIYMYELKRCRFVYSFMCIVFYKWFNFEFSEAISTFLFPIHEC